MANATLAYWDQNPQSPEARLTAARQRAVVRLLAPPWPAEFVKLEPELLRRARIAAGWVSGAKDEVIATELGQNPEQVKKTRQRFIRLIGLGEYRHEKWRQGQLIELSGRYCPMREGRASSHPRPRDS